MNAWKRKEVIGDATLYLGDCMEYMRSLPDCAFDLAIVDPPYAVGAADGNFGGKKAHPCAIRGYKNNYANHDAPPDEYYFRELFRISKHQIIWGANYYPQYLRHSGWIVWDKLTTGPLSDCELAFQSINKLVRKFTSAWSGFNKKDSHGNAAVRVHPNQKPVRLYEWCLSEYAKTGQRILDTHFGSGSLAIATNALKYELVACEIDENYYSIACERISRAYAQGKLFDEPPPKPQQMEIDT